MRWLRHAQCATETVDMISGKVSDALEVCGRCPVRAECLDEALADPTTDVGVRGGMTAACRKAKRKAERKRQHVRPTPGAGVGS